MSGPNELDRLLASWMEADGPQDVPARVVQRAFRDARRVDQQRHLRGVLLGWLPRSRAGTLAGRRSGAVPRLAAVLLALVLLALLAAGGLLVGSQLLRAAPSPSPLPSPTAPLLQLPLSYGSIAAGTYALGSPTYDSDGLLARMTAAVPDGWSGIRGRTFAHLFQDSDDHPTGSIALQIPSNFFIDACDPEVGVWDPPLGPTVDDFVTAVADVPGYEVTAPTDVTWLGYTGTYLEVTAPPSVAACGDFMNAWQTENGETAQYLVDGQHDRLWVLDVEGTRLLIALTAEHAAPRPTGTDPASMAEQQAVFDSIRIAPAPSPTAAPSASPGS